MPDTDWYLVSSPVSGETFDDFYANSHTLAQNASGLLGFAPYVNNATSVWEYQTSASTIAINSGQGYSVKLASDGDISFSGTMNTTTVMTPITTGTTSDFNLLGNPFTGYINSGTFASTNTSLLTEQTIWVWNGSQYEAKNATGAIEISPAQGFFVHALSNGNVSFDTSNLNHNSSDTFMKANTFDGFDLVVDDQTEKKSTKIFYIEGKTTGFDNGYDSSVFSGSANSFEVFTGLVANHEEMQLAIQTLPNDDYENLIIPVGIKAEANSELTFSLENLNIDDSISVYLENKLDDTFNNLSDSNYSTTLDENSDGIGQFYIHTLSKSLSNYTITAQEGVNIYKTESNKISVSGLQSEGKLTVFSILGKEILTTPLNNHKNLVDLQRLNSGIYIIKVNTDSQEIVKKIIF